MEIRLTEVWRLTSCNAVEMKNIFPLLNNLAISIFRTKKRETGQRSQTHGHKDTLKFSAQLEQRKKANWKIFANTRTQRNKIPRPAGTKKKGKPQNGPKHTDTKKHWNSAPGRNKKKGKPENGPKHTDTKKHSYSAPGRKKKGKNRVFGYLAAVTF